MSSEFISIFGHLAFCLIFLSFLVKEIFWLRTLSFTAGIFSIMYNSYIAATPLWTPIQWNLVFMATNLYHIAWILKENQKVELQGYEKFIHEKVFQQFSPIQFKKLLKISRVNVCHKDQNIINNNEEIDSLYLVMHGELSIEIEQKNILNLNEGKFVGEMSFITGELPRADVFARNSDIRLLSWETEELKILLSKNPEINSLFTATLGRQLINELMAKNSHQKQRNFTE